MTEAEWRRLEMVMTRAVLAALRADREMEEESFEDQLANALLQLTDNEEVPSGVRTTRS